MIHIGPDDTNVQVLGFAYDDLYRIALIYKTHPQYLANRWNGIGGKVKNGESPRQAMFREFLEETGVAIDGSLWYAFGTMTMPERDILLFVVQDQIVRAVKTQTEEPVKLWLVHQLRDDVILRNLPVLISASYLALTDKSFRLSLHYEKTIGSESAPKQG